MEQGELLLVGGAVVGAEDGAVAALVAHPVHVEDLPPPVGQCDDHVRPVGAYVGADLADRVAGQAAVALPLGGLAEDALLGDAALPGGDGLLRDSGLVGVADDLLGEGGGVGDALHHRGGAPEHVSGGVDPGQVGGEGRTALLAHMDAVGGQLVVVHPLAHGGDHRVAGELHRLAGVHRGAAAALVGLAQLHLPAQELAVLLLHGGDQLQELHPVGHGQLQLLSVGGHVLLGPPIDQGAALRPGTEGQPGGVHGGVAAAHHRHVAQGLPLPGLHGPHPGDDGLHVAGNVQPAGLPGAHGEEDVGVALALQLLHRGGRGAQQHLHPHLAHEGGVLLDGRLGDAEIGDHIPDHAAQGGLPLKEGGGHAGPGAEVGRRHAGGAAADDSHLLPVVDRGGGLQLGHDLAVAPLRRHQLGVPNLDGPVVEGAGALVHAVVGADGAGDEGQGVLLQNDFQRGGVVPLAAQLDVLGDVLADGAAALAGGGEAVHQGHLAVKLPPGQGLDGLHVVLVLPDGQGQGLHLVHVHLSKGVEGQGLQLLADLRKALVAAGLQLCGGHGDGPDAALEELVDVEEVRAAGVAQPQPPVKFLTHPPGHLDGQGEEALAGHVHLLAGQLALLHVHGEGVGELQAELQAPLTRQSQQAAEHGDGVGVLQVLVEVLLPEGDVVVAHAVQDVPGGPVAQKGGVALDEGVEALFRDEVGGDPLDLVRRAAVEGGDGDGVGDPGGDGGDQVLLPGEHLPQDLDALLEDGRPGGVHHLVEVLVDLGALDALQVVAHGHVEHEAVGLAQAADPGEDVAGTPGFHVLLVGLLDVELRGPLAVVALVLRQDAGPGDAGGQIRAVHLLHGLQLEEPGPGEVAGDDVLGQLGVGTRRRAEGGLDLLPAEDGQGLLPGHVGPVDPEDGALLPVLRHDPVH